MTCDHFLCEKDTKKTLSQVISFGLVFDWNAYQKSLPKVEIFGRFPIKIPSKIGSLSQVIIFEGQSAGGSVSIAIGGIIGAIGVDGMLWWRCCYWCW
jgi:hypothetical protein